MPPPSRSHHLPHTPFTSEEGPRDSPTRRAGSVQGDAYIKVSTCSFHRELKSASYYEMDDAE